MMLHSLAIAVDNTEIRTALEAALTAEGYAVQCVTLSVLLAYPLPTLLILEDRLEGGDSLAALERLHYREGWQHVAVILLTSGLNETEVRRAWDLGVDTFQPTRNVPPDVMTTEVLVKVRRLMKSLVEDADDATQANRAPSGHLVGIAQELRRLESTDLQARDYTFQDEVYSPRTFGNSYAELKSGRLLVRFVRDRGYYELRFTSEDYSNRWWDADVVAELLTQSAATEYPHGARDLGAVLRWFQGFEKEIKLLFKPKQVEKTIIELERIQERRLQEFYEKQASERG